MNKNRYRIKKYWSKDRAKFYYTSQKLGKIFWFFPYWWTIGDYSYGEIEDAKREINQYELHGGNKPKDELIHYEPEKQKLYFHQEVNKK